MAQFKRIFTLILCVAMLFCATITAEPINSAYAASSAELQAQLDAAKAESNRIKAEIANLKAANAPYTQQRAAIQRQIDATKREISLYESQISKCEERIAELNSDIADRESEMEAYIDDFKGRLVAIYTGKNSFITDLSFLMSSESLSDYLAKSELLESVSRRDADKLEQIKVTITEIEQQKSETEATRADLDSSKAEMDIKKQELAKQYTEVNSIVLSNQEAIAEAQREEAAAKRLEQSIKEALETAKLYENGQMGTGKFAWPVPGHYTISSKFGYRIHPLSGKWKLHAGTDICSNNGTVYGSRIVAADSGTVTGVKYDRYGYGHYVIIDHNNGYITLYAHMKAASPLKVGDTVYKGKTLVGYVGASGGVDGPHLHFEIRKNGTPIDPMQFY